jgi:hypothetical protein
VGIPICENPVSIGVEKISKVYPAPFLIVPQLSFPAKISPF